jgi:hypothetical protein
MILEAHALPANQDRGTSFPARHAVGSQHYVWRFSHLPQRLSVILHASFDGATAVVAGSGESSCRKLECLGRFVFIHDGIELGVFDFARLR